MMTRTTSKTVIFAQPFVVNERDGELLPGVYTVEIEEEGFERVSSTHSRRMSLVMPCRANDGIPQYIPVEPGALAAALARDVRCGD